MIDIKNIEDVQALTEQLVVAVLKLTPKKKKMLAALLNEWETPPSEESREDLRMYCFFPVDYSTRSRLYQDFINNLSTGGVFIETSAALDVGEPLSMIFNMPLLQQSFKIFGQIVRTERDGVGVKFDKKLTDYQKNLVIRSSQ